MIWEKGEIQRLSSSTKANTCEELKAYGRNVPQTLAHDWGWNSKTESFLYSPLKLLFWVSPQRLQNFAGYRRSGCWVLSCCPGPILKVLLRPAWFCRQGKVTMTTNVEVEIAEGIGGTSVVQGVKWMYWKLFFLGGVDDDCDSVGDASWLVPGWGANAHLRRWGEDEPLPSVDSRVDIRVLASGVGLLSRALSECIGSSSSRVVSMMTVTR